MAGRLPSGYLAQSRFSWKRSPYRRGRGADVISAAL